MRARLLAAAALLVWSPGPALAVASGRLRGHGSRRSAVTQQLVLSGKPASLEEMPEATQRNVRRALELNPELRPRWLGDAACRDFIGAHFGAGLLAAFEGERRGSFRGDICRAAVLRREGGFYMDVDVQPRVPFSQMVDNTTTFMAAFSSDGGILNALLAVEPGSEVMQAVVARIEEWYAPGSRQNATSTWMGPATMLRGLRDVVQRECPSVGLSDRHQWACGPRQVVRLYTERHLQCFGAQAEEECPETRRESTFEGLRYGIFEPGPQGRLVAWSRFEACGGWGCDSGGWDESPAVKAALLRGFAA